VTTLYFDHNASTPVLPRVRAVMAEALEQGFGNPSAGHAFGRRSRAIVDRARAQVAALLCCDADEIVFTSSGTEANNIALRGYARAGERGPRALVTTAIEHPSVAEPAEVLAREGTAVLVLGASPTGEVSADEIARAVASVEDPAPLVSVMLAQNETGVIQPVGDIARRARQKGAVVHTDASQAVGKIEVDVNTLAVDLLSVAGHKLYAPKGVGALYVRRGIRVRPVLVGAGHERGLRPGTENVAGIAGLGEACAVAREDLASEWARQRALRDRLEAKLARAGFVTHGAGAPRLPNTLNGRFPGVRGSVLLGRVPEVAFSTGSACHAGEERPSTALTAMGLSPDHALGAVRLSIGRTTTEACVDRAAELLAAAAADRAP
jgi:cysteine desulfurase